MRLDLVLFVLTAAAACNGDRPLPAGDATPLPCPSGAARIGETSPQAIVLALDRDRIAFSQTTVAGEDYPVGVIDLGDGAVRALGRANNFHLLALWGEHVYLADYRGPLRRIHVGGGEPEVLTQEMIVVNRIAVDASGVYVVGRSTRAGWDRVWRVAHAGGALEIVGEDRFTWRYTTDYSASDLAELVLDEDSVYWTQPSGVGEHGGDLSDGKLWRAPKSGGAPLLLADGLVAPGGLARAGDVLHFSAWSDPSRATSYVGAVPRSGGETRRILTLSEEPGGIAPRRDVLFDGHTFYFAGRRERPWYRQRIGGEREPWDIGVPFRDPIAILDPLCSFIYFSDDDFSRADRPSTIWRIPR